MDIDRQSYIYFESHSKKILCKGNCIDKVWLL